MCVDSINAACIFDSISSPRAPDTAGDGGSMGNPVFAVRLEAALKARPFISKGETHYYLNGVHIQSAPDGGAYCVATDGHRLAVSFDPEGFVDGSAIVRIPSIIKLERKLFKPQWLVGVQTVGARGYIAVVDGHEKDGQEDNAQYAIERVEECVLRVGNAFIDGTFPDWKRVIPAPKPTDVTRSFNREYLRSFGDRVQLTGADENSPNLVRTDDPNFLGVLMPMRIEERLKGLPSWLETEHAAKAA